MMNITDRIASVQLAQNSLLCIGLDSDVAKLPECVHGAENPQLEFNRRIIEATKDFVCAYKINMAFYEAAGEAGWSTMRKTLALIPKTILTIGDAKRADIGNSSAQYAVAILQNLGCDAITVHPYMGADSVMPFLQFPDKGVFLLALTSNSGAKDFQYLKVGRSFLYQKVISTSLKWNINNNLGFVVGATKSHELKSIRKKAPTVPILIPGVGAQGGSLEESVRHGCDARGLMALINVSRSVIFASSGNDFAERARAEAEKLFRMINLTRSRFFDKRQKR